MCNECLIMGCCHYSLTTACRCNLIHTTHALKLFRSHAHTTHGFSIYKTMTMSMGIVGVNSTAGREVKFIDPSKTTKSESSWLGYTLCDCRICCYYHRRVIIHSYDSLARARVIHTSTLTLYNEERRLGDQRGSDTLVVPLITSNDGLSIAFFTLNCKYPQPTK